MTAQNHEPSYGDEDQSQQLDYANPIAHEIRPSSMECDEKEGSGIHCDSNTFQLPRGRFVAVDGEQVLRAYDRVAAAEGQKNGLDRESCWKEPLRSRVRLLEIDDFGTGAIGEECRVLQVY